jgi:hypothetical protein
VDYAMDGWLKCSFGISIVDALQIDGCSWINGFGELI